MDSCQEKEIVITDRSVVPGYLYDDAKKRFFPRMDGKSIRCVKLPAEFKIDIWDKKMICSYVQRNTSFRRQWEKDFLGENPADAVLFKGVKIQKETAKSIPLDSLKYTVTSIIHEGQVDMLILLKRGLAKEELQKVHVYLQNKLHGNGEDSIPTKILFHFVSAFIYQGFNSTGTKQKEGKYSLSKFCLILKNEVNTFPRTAVIKSPIALSSVDKISPNNVHASSTAKVLKPNASLSTIYVIDTPQVHGTRNSIQKEGHKNQLYTNSEKGINPRKIQTYSDNEKPVRSNCERGFSALIARRMPCSTESTTARKRCIWDKTTENFETSKLSDHNNKVGLAYSRQRTPLSVKHGGGEIQGVTSELQTDKDNVVTTQPKRGIKLSESNTTVPATITDLVRSHQNTKASESSEYYNLQATIDANPTSDLHGSRLTETSFGPESYAGMSYSNSFSAIDVPHTSIRGEDCNQEPKRLLGPTSEFDHKYTENFSSDSNLKGKTKEKEAYIKSQRKLNQSYLNSEPPKVQENSKKNKTISGYADDESSVMLASPQLHIYTKEEMNGQKFQMGSNTKSKLIIPVKVVRDACGLDRKYYGIVNKKVSEKVIMLLGASGSGKTTLVNFIANYFQGNESADNELVHVETVSQTLTITAYTFCMATKDIPITVIDTPGLNDSSGGEIRDHVTSMKTFLANTASKNFNIHAIGFVAQAHIVRLTSSERLVMDYLTTMFNRDVSNHLITFVTFADTSDTPPVIEAMKNYKVNFKHYFKFNNSILSMGALDEVDELDRVYFRVCWRNWKKCLKTLNDMPPLAIKSMKAVQREVYTTTITDSAKADLKAEIHTLFKCYKLEKILSDKNLQVCEQIWTLAAVVHRLTTVQNSGLKDIQNILIETAMEVCTELNVPPQDNIYIFALAPSKALNVAGIEIVRSMAQVYGYSKKCSEVQVPNKNIVGSAYCYVCKKDHKMERTKLSWLGKTLTLNSDVICLQCVECSCSGHVHGVQPYGSAPQANTIVLAALHSLRKALQSHSLPGFIVQEETFLRHISEQLSSEYQEFMNAILKMVRR